MRDNLNNRLLDAIRSVDVEAMREVIRNYRENPFDQIDVDAGLCLGAKTGHAEVTRLLLQLKADVTYTDQDGCRALHYAAEIGSAEIVKQIISAGSPVNVADAQGYTAVHYAAGSGHTQVAALLIQQGANINRAKSYRKGETPLHMACRTGRTDTAKLLIAKGAHLNAATTDEKLTPLHLAVRGRYLHTTKLLCDFGCDLDQVDSLGKTPLFLATEHSALEIILCLVESGANTATPDCRGRTPLHNLAASSTTSQPIMTQIAEVLIQATQDLEHCDSEGFTALHYAGVSGNVDMAILLLSAGVNIDARDFVRGETSLALAIAHNRVEMVRLLTTAGANVNSADKEGLTPLHKIQASRGTQKAELVELLITHGAQLNTATTQGYTPLDRCVFHSVIGNYNREILKRLVLAGAHLKPVFVSGRHHHNSPLCWLTWHGALETARFLVQSGWDLQKEAWIFLPGKDEKTDEFLEWLREEARQPRMLRTLCRVSIREYLNLMTEDRDIDPLLDQLPLPGIINNFLRLSEEIKTLEEAV